MKRNSKLGSSPRQKEMKKARRIGPNLITEVIKLLTHDPCVEVKAFGYSRATKPDYIGRYLALQAWNKEEMELFNREYAPGGNVHKVLSDCATLMFDNLRFEEDGPKDYHRPYSYQITKLE